MQAESNGGKPAALCDGRSIPGVLQQGTSLTSRERSNGDDFSNHTSSPLQKSHLGPNGIFLGIFSFMRNHILLATVNDRLQLIIMSRVSNSP